MAVALSLILIPSFFKSVSYDLTGSFGSTPNSEADKTSDLIQAQFQSESTNGGGSGATNNSIIVVIQNTSVYSDMLKQQLLVLNQTIAVDKDISNYTGQTSLYTLESSLLNSSIPSILNQTASLQSNIASINSGLYMLQNNLSVLSLNLFQLQDGINQTAQLVYGVPSAFVGVWQGVSQQLATQGDIDTNDINMAANATMYNVTNNFGGDATSIGYYSAFFGAWNASFQVLPASTSLQDREAFAVNQAVTAILSSQQLDAETGQMVTLVASELTVNNWNQPSATADLATSTMVSSIPSDLSSALGASPSNVINELYSFGASPSNKTLADYAITLLETSYSNMSSTDAGFTISDLMNSAYQLGELPKAAIKHGI